jgi:hypothetical protein
MAGLSSFEKGLMASKEILRSMECSDEARRECDLNILVGTLDADLFQH